MGSIGKNTNSYIRFGEIPTTGKSVNYLKLTFSENEDFTYWLSSGETIEQALRYATGKNDISKYLEEGVSVFKMDSDGLPKIENLQQAMSLATRLDKNIYTVQGSKISEGQDDEPVINVTDYKKLNISQQKLISKIENTLRQNYNVVKNSDFPDSTSTDIHEFTYYNYGNEKPRYKNETKYITFNGKEYSSPKKNWNTHTGAGRKGKK